VPTSPQAGLLLLFVNLCGFVINSATIPGGWIAVYWANPVTYMFTSLAVNEFTSPDWATPVDGTPIGEIVLQTRGYQQKYLYVWLAIFVWGAAASVLNFVACVFFLATLPAPKPPVVMSEEAYELQLKARAGLDAELPEELRGSSKRKKGSTASLASLGKSASHPSLPGTAPPPAASDEDSGKLGKAAVGDVESQGPPASQGGSSLPFKPLSMTFADVRYSVPYPKDAAHPEGSDKQEGPHAGQLLLLKGITGSFRAGVLTALMGASGAGKTTLMDVLAGRKTGGTITGDIRVNGFPQDQATFARVAGYCEQTDIHVPHTSVHEALQFRWVFACVCVLGRSLLQSFQSVLIQTRASMQRVKLAMDAAVCLQPPPHRSSNGAGRAVPGSKRAPLLPFPPPAAPACACPAALRGSSVRRL
jgi:ABC-type multidrug transport system fused ATPase/permease subunit